MSPHLATMIKINSLVKMMAEDEKILAEAEKDPRQAFSKLGIELSQDEVLAITDVVQNTRTSNLSKRPAEPTDWIESLNRQLGNAQKR
ncbi:hypothetical protein ACT4MK_36925 [Bradyrhizobium barranii]|uniref:hypothetical protein n=1 Tax=Bradyrhizobium TaxID=374 RepID=UPI003F1E81DB